MYTDISSAIYIQIPNVALNPQFTYHNQHVDTILSMFSSNRCSKGSQKVLGGSYTMMMMMSHHFSLPHPPSHNLPYKAPMGLGINPALLEVKVTKPLRPLSNMRFKK